MLYGKTVNIPLVMAGRLGERLDQKSLTFDGIFYNNGTVRKK